MEVNGPYDLLFQGHDKLYRNAIHHFNLWYVACFESDLKVIHPKFINS